MNVVSHMLFRICLAILLPSLPLFANPDPISIQILDDIQSLKHRDPYQAIKAIEDADPAVLPNKWRIAVSVELFDLYQKVGMRNPASQLVQDLRKVIEKESDLHLWIIVLQARVALVNHKPKEAKKLLQGILERISQSDDLKLAIHFKLVETSLNVRSSNYTTAFEILNQILANSISIGDLYLQSIIQQFYTQIFYHMQNYDKAIESTKKQLELADQMGDNFVRTAALTDQMNIYDMKSRELRRKITEAKTKIEKSRLLKENEKALKLSRERGQQAIELSRKIGAYQTLLRALIMQQTYAIRQYDNKKALALCQEVIAIARERGFLYEEGVSYNNIAIALRGTDQHLEGLEALQKAEEIYKKLDIKKSLNWILEDYSYAYELNKEYKKALDYYQRYHRAAMRLMLQTNSDKVLELQEQFEADKKERELERLTQQNKLTGLEKINQRIVFIGLTIGFLLIAGLQYNRNMVVRQKNLDLQRKEELVREKTRDLRSILDNIHQGVVTLGLSAEEQVVTKDSSHHVNAILGISDEVNLKNFEPMELLFLSSDLSNEQIALINTIIQTSIGAYEFQWQVNLSHLPSEMKLREGKKIIELDWSVILEENVVTKILITLKDVTEIRYLAKQQEENESNIQKLICLSLMEQREYFIFMDSVDKLLSEARKVIESHPNYVRDAIDVAFRDLHTIKGLARTYQMSLLSSFIHEVEETFHRMRDQKEMYDHLQCLKLLDQIAREIASYVELAKTKLKWDINSATVTLPVSDLSRWHDDLFHVKEEGKLKDRHFENLLKEIKKKYSSTFYDTLRDIFMNASKLAREMDKGEVEFSVSGDEVFVAREHLDKISSIFVHLIRNAIDHGIATLTERKQGYLPDPKIEIVLARHENYFQAIFLDNGRGLDLETLECRARDQGYAIQSSSPLDIAELIFRSGLSTKEQISDISGRGVGMDAVKSYLENHGGEIKIQPTGEVVNGFLPIAFVMKLPPAFFET